MAGEENQNRQPVRPDTDADVRKRAIYRVTLVGTVGNLALLVFKFVAAIVGRSSAMLADAVHSLSDFVTDFIVLVFVRISSKPRDADHQYGHGKYETLATAIVGTMLFFVGVGILIDGGYKIWRYLQGEVLPEPGMIALWAALISIVVKEALYRMTVRVGRRYDSSVVVANAWHHRSDALSSIGTALGIGGAILFGVKGRVLDPLAAVVVSLFIIKVAVQFVVPCVNELLEQSLPPDVERQIIDAILSCPEVSQPHNLRTRRIGNYAAVDVHVRMDPDMTVRQSHEVTRRIECLIRGLLGPNTYVSVHVEPRS